MGRTLISGLRARCRENSHIRSESKRLAFFMELRSCSKRPRPLLMAVISSAEQRSDDALPVDVDALPVDVGALPTLDDALSAVNDALPAVDDTLPAVVDVLPAVNDVLPAVNDALPAVDDALPNDALPSVSQRRISASSWQRSASSAVNRSSSRP